MEIDPELFDVVGAVPSGTGDADVQETPVKKLFSAADPLDETETAALDSAFRKTVQDGRARSFSPAARLQLLQKGMSGDMPDRPALLGGDREEEFDLDEVDGSKSRWKAIYKGGQLADCQFVCDVAA